MSYQPWKHEPFYWAPTKRLGGGWIAHKSAPAAPPAPDYSGAATATAAGNLEAAKYATEANRVNQTTPWGSVTWNKTTTQPTFDQAGYDSALQAWQRNQSQLGDYGSSSGHYVSAPMPTRDQFTSGGGVDKWTQTTTLTPELQSALDSQLKIQQNQSNLAQTMQGQVQSTMSTPFKAPDYASYLSSVPGVQASFAGFNPSGSGTNTDIKGALQGVGGVGYFNPASLQQAGGASAGNVATDASGYLGGVPGVNYDSRGYTNGAQPVSYDAPQFDAAMQKKYTDAAYASSTRLLGDQWSQQNNAMDVQLRLQGLTPGTEAYNNAMQNALKSQDFTRAQLADTALITGSQVANQDYASMLAGYKARNDAQAQDFGQRLQNFGADLSAQNQGFTQGMSKANYAQTGMNMNAQNGIAAAQVNNQATQLNNQSALAAYAANLGAQNQSFNQAITGFDAGNAAQQQRYNQDLAGFGANQATQQAANAAQAQAYGQAQNNYLTAYQSALSNYTMPLNMMNAVLGGNQVQNPQFSGYYTQGQTAGPDLLGAASSLGQYNSGVAAQGAANAASGNSTTAALGSAAITAAAIF